MPKAKTRKAGRPTKYKPEYCQSIIQFFETDYYEHGENIPWICTYAKTIGVYTSTVNRWGSPDDPNSIPEFCEALKECKAIQEKKIAEGGLSGKLNSTMCIFALKNVAGWRDRTEQKVEFNDVTDPSTKQGFRELVRNRLGQLDLSGLEG